MSDLQIGLAMLGVVVVAAVVAFNWWQERKFRQGAEETFPGRHDDILLDQQPAATPPSPAPAPGYDEPRIEPRMEPQLEASGPEQRDAAPAAMPAAPAPQSEVDYVAEIRAGEFIPAEHLALLQQKLAAVGRKVAFSGFDYQSKSWGSLLPDGGRYTSLRAAIQLVDRSGPLTLEQLQAFGDALRESAQQMSAIAELPDFAPAVEQAGRLDEFCAEVDVVVGINVIARTGQIFHGTKIRALAEAAGFRLEPDGVFMLEDERGDLQFSLENQEPEPFLIDRVRTLTTSGITFLLDVPRIGGGLRAFDRMVAVSRSFAESLDGMLADDNRVALNDTGLDRIRNQLRSIYAAMDDRGIRSGSPLALRLFS